ncbi:sigma-54-dependent Fis family transcriptional regulator [Vibrio sp. S17_S38]|uniref:sigma-54 dependent transcriptional regulator n=1 Tax=Vibrio sp. S17_S38 TaxID=2720229 RepID=UPI001680EEFD|nr:VpsR-related response regulator [Vibrio sp. S17_S38]MBD1572807.1 sigma-54-dependent Fis family transcriptional regulator [Vibrio sp. S17_S38]
MHRQFKMNTMPGSLIVIGGVTEYWIDSVRKSGWICYQCGDFRLAQPQLDKIVGPCIGIIDLCQENLSLHAISRLISTNKHIRWLAYIKENQLNSDPICQFIIHFCADFFTSPMPEKRLLDCIGHQFGMLQLEKKIWPDNSVNNHTGLIGDSLSMKRLREQIKRLALTNASIIISGEQGTGKMTAAYSIHQYSPRNKGPVIVINCGALSEQSLEQDVFGIHCDNSTAGSLSKIEQANGGTLIFKDVTALPFSQQKNLHNLLTSQSIEAFHGSQLIDVRVLVTTHHEIETHVQDKAFLSELFYHLNVLKIHVPSLKDRCTDIHSLAYYYLQQNSREYNAQVRTISPKAIKYLMNHHWPGNVRELINQIKRAVLMSESSVIEIENFDLPKRISNKRNLRTIREDSERKALLCVLENHDGQVSLAAKELGISRATMYRLLGKYNLSAETKGFIC